SRWHRPEQYRLGSPPRYVRGGQGPPHSLHETVTGLPGDEPSTRNRGRPGPWLTARPMDAGGWAGVVGRASPCPLPLQYETDSGWWSPREEPAADRAAATHSDRRHPRSHHRLPAPLGQGEQDAEPQRFTLGQHPPVLLAQCGRRSLVRDVARVHPCLALGRRLCGPRLPVLAL